MAISQITNKSITDATITADDIASGAVEGAMTTQLGRRNLAYNGAMTVWQRGTSADTASAGDYMCDRWRINYGGLDGNVDWDQETTSTPDGFGYALKVSTDASETSLDAADFLIIQQRFEGQDLQQLQKGTSGAKSLTLSFWVKSSVASTYTAELYDADNTRVIGKSYTISSADTWEFKTLTFGGDTTGAFDNDNALSLLVAFWIDAGSDYTSGTFSTAWQANADTERVYDTTGWLESTTPTFYITGVQLEVGSVATPFEHRSFGEELALCQRYYVRYPSKAASNAYTFLASGMCVDGSANQGLYVIDLPVTMRSNPTLGSGGTFRQYNGGTLNLTSGPTLHSSSESTMAFVAASGAGLNTLDAVLFGTNNDNDAYLEFKAEL